MSGYCVTGRVAKPITPRITIKIEITVDKIQKII